MAAPALPASLLHRLRDGAALVIVAPGLAGPPWRPEVAALVAELADGYGVEVVGDGGAGNGATGEPAGAAAIAWLEALRDACRDGAAPRGSRTELMTVAELTGELAATWAGDDDGDEADAAGGPGGPAIEALMEQVEHAADAGERARLLREVAEIYEAEAGDPRRALAAIVAACRTAPGDDTLAGEAARLAAVTGRWPELVRDAARLADELAEAGDAALAARWWTRVGDWYATRIGDLEAAMQAYEAAVTADPGAIAALVALLELYGETGSTDEHRQTRARLAQVVERAPDHRQATEIWLRLAESARAAGEPRAAEAAFRTVIAGDPLHAAARAALVELAAARNEWRAAIELHRDEIDALTGVPDSAARRGKLAEQIGDLWQDRLGDPGAAIAAYEQAVALAPTRGLWHKLLEAFTQQRKWRRAIDALDRLAGEEASPERRARFHYAAAVIARDELDDGGLAIDKLTAALDDAPLTAGAFDALDDLLAERGAWKQQARAYRQQLTRLGDAEPVRQRALWLSLAEVCVDRLGDPETAIAAYQVACALDPDDADHREQLVELYLAAGEPRRRDAIAELQTLLAAAPGRIELYKALAGLYLAEGALDKAWCVAQVLVVLGAASDDEARLYARHRPHGLQPAQRRLTEELWQQIAHPGEDRRVGALVAAAGGAIALGTAQPIAAFALDPEARVDVAHDPRAASRIVHHVTSVLAIDPAPMVWLDAGDGLRIANTLAPVGDAERPRLVPSLLIGAAALGVASPGELLFAAGKRLAFLRPERFVAFAVATLPRLEAAIAAVRRAADAGAGDAPEDLAARTLADELRGRLPGPVLERLAELAAGLPERAPVASWRAATDLTANRVGLVIANDLDAAVRAIATEGPTLAGLAAKDRIRDLLGFAASERYFAVRRHLGQQIPDE